MRWTSQLFIMSPVPAKAPALNMYAPLLNLFQVWYFSLVQPLLVRYQVRPACVCAACGSIRCPDSMPSVIIGNRGGSAITDGQPNCCGRRTTGQLLHPPAAAPSSVHPACPGRGVISHAWCAALSCWIHEVGARWVGGWVCLAGARSARGLPRAMSLVATNNSPSTLPSARRQQS